MKEKFIDYFLKFGPLSDAEIDLITNDLRIERFDKGHQLLVAGQRAFDNYFVLSGCVRQFYLNDGDESTTQFYTEEHWILPAIAQAESEISRFYLECVEDCHLVVANENDGNEMLHDNKRFQALSQIVLEKEIVKQQQHFVAFQNYTPEQRYLNLQKNRPDLIERIPQYQLSSYLGVKPESLSRIRKRLADKSRILNSK